jgi:hypothetical protein
MSKKLDLVAVDHGTIHAKAAMRFSLLNDPMYNVHIGTQQLGCSMCACEELLN